MKTSGKHKRYCGKDLAEWLLPEPLGTRPSRAPCCCTAEHFPVVLRLVAPLRPYGNEPKEANAIHDASKTRTTETMAKTHLKHAS